VAGLPADAVAADDLLAALSGRCASEGPSAGTRVTAL